MTTARIHLLSIMIVVPTWAACVGNAPSDGEQPNTEDPECQLDTEGERSPGYPYDLQLFANEVLPVITGSCAAVGCHGAPEGQGNFTVWADAAPGNCNYAKTFNAIAGHIDLAKPQNSSLIAAINGTNAIHPIKYVAGDPALDTLSAYANDASQRYQNDGGGGDTAPPGASPFDYTVFQSQIQPILDTSGGVGCAGAGCHGSGAGNFALNPTPAPNSPEMQANFLAVTSRTNLDDALRSVVYLQATTVHGGGGSTRISDQEAATMLAWIEAAIAAAGDSGDDANNCPPIDRFNLGVFREEIMPILSGELDLNSGGVGGGTGCTAGPCHGTDRGPGTLNLDLAATPEDNLQNFACFVDLTTPARSEILACPLNQPGCRRYPHPGQAVFGGADDLNYQRVLAYLYGSRMDATPLDYAFFVRQINPIFNDPNAVATTANGRTCADSSCHGVAIAGQPAPNGSNFPIISAASDNARLALNYVAAASFVNFLDPDDSSLFLYPTNEIANVADHPLATGLPHPGGASFAVNSDQARAILTWAAGLRPDADGFQRNWLVAGDFAATQVSDLTVVNEASVQPSIFDASGGSFNAGQWDGLFADDELVDLNDVFPRPQGSSRVAYAVTYLVNITPAQLQVQVQIDTDNPARIYVGNALAAQDDDGGGVSAIVNLPPYSVDRTAVRVLVKLLQRPGDAGLNFTAQLRDTLGIPLTDATGEVIVTLDPNGGI